MSGRETNLRDDLHLLLRARVEFVMTANNVNVRDWRMAFFTPIRTLRFCFALLETSFGEPVAQCLLADHDTVLEQIVMNPVAQGFVTFITSLLASACQFLYISITACRFRRNSAFKLCMLPIPVRLF
jgi:hypothetical protein